VKAMPIDDPIDGYVAELSRALHGPRRAKRDLIAEVRDGLIDAAEAYQAAGLDRPEAERRAVAEFGTVGEIAPGLQEELAAATGQRLGALLFLSAPLMALAWYVIWRFDPVEVVGRPAGWFGPVARAMDLMQFGIGVLGGLAVLAQRSGRFRPGPAARALGLCVLGSFPVTVALYAAMLAGTAGVVTVGVPVLGLTAVSWAVWGVQLAVAWRCLLVSRPRRAWAPARCR